eukprot:scaffold11.g4053.t1
MLAGKQPSAERPAGKPKTSWPELVGTPVDEAVALLQAETGLNVVPISADRMVTADYQTDRIRVFYEEAGQTVARAPRIG